MYAEIMSFERAESRLVAMEYIEWCAFVGFLLSVPT